jgi:S1-C subfamily serine protease
MTKINSSLVKIQSLFAMTLAVSFLGGRPAAAQTQVQPRPLPITAMTPDTIADIIAKAAPSVVNIVTSTSVERPRPTPSYREKSDAARRFRHYWGIDTAPSEQEALRITGSGIVLKSNGIILTSLHVIDNADTITVGLKDGRGFDAKIIARDSFSDLAVLKIPAEGLPAAVFGDPSTLRLGDWVVAIGNQFGLGHTATQGIVSGLGREAKGFEKSFGARTGQLRFIQTDAPINPGSSGGPLLNLKGEVIGVNTFIRDDAQNIAFAVPSDIAKAVAEKLLNAGTVAHPYVGIVMKEPNPGQALHGVEITEVSLRSPAAKAGIAAGDVVMALDDKPVLTSDDVSLTVAKHNVGDSIKFKLKRDGVDREVNVRVDSLPSDGT